MDCRAEPLTPALPLPSPLLKGRGRNTGQLCCSACCGLLSRNSPLALLAFLDDRGKAPPEASARRENSDKMNPPNKDAR